MHHFFAYMARMRNIVRWPLMRNTQTENIQEHSLQVAMLAHGLAMIANRRLGRNVDLGEVVQLALYHDAGEVITGDMPTPVKYMNPEIRQAYRQIERIASQKLLSMLPEDFRDAYGALLQPSEACPAMRYVKAADKLAAYLKCVEEARCGNEEFAKAQENILRELRRLQMPEVEIFLEEFAPSFAMTLDELN